MKMRHTVMLLAGFTLGAARAQQASPEVAATQAMGPRVTLKIDLEKALLTTENFEGLRVKATKSATGLWMLNVAPDGIGWSTGATDTGQHAEATVAVGWYDEDGKLMGNLAQEQTFKRVIVDGDAVYSMHVQIPPGVVRVRFVVRDALNGRMGTTDLTTF